ncbi:MAG: bis-aminopropyl spermidine synthase family protein [Chloroflexia bacterium]
MLTDKANLLRSIAERAQLREGSAGVEEVLRVVYRTQHSDGSEPMTARVLARLVRLPLPVVTALRRELEKSGVLEPGPHLHLTSAADSVIGNAWGWAGSNTKAVAVNEQPNRVICAECDGLGVHPQGSAWTAMLGTLRKHFEKNPRVDVTLDQSFCTPETNVRRVALMYEAGALAGKDVLILGDDDSVSIAVGLAGKALAASGSLAKRVVALDTDGRILNHLGEIAVKESVQVDIVRHDVRYPLPAELRGAFDTVSTDPPYTLPGLELFLSRAVEAIKPDGGQIYLHFGHRPPDEQVAVLASIAGMGLMIERLTPNFNEYVGAGVLAGVSDLYVLRTTEVSRPGLEGEFTGELYTGEVRPTLRVYACTTCGKQLTVGGQAGGEFATIEALKEEGCPQCGGHGFKLISRKQVSGAAERPKEG